MVAAGGGGIPMVREDGVLRGVEAVLDKDLTAALLARTVGADVLLIATDVEAAAIGYGTERQEWLGEVEPDRLQALLDAGEFAGGSMGPKVQAALSFRPRRRPVGHHEPRAAARGRRGQRGDARMSERVIVRPGAYYDSVTLMLVSRAASATEGAEAVAVGMATPLNVELLRDQGFTVDAGPNDLVIAVRARDDDAIEAAVAAVERELASKGAPAGAVERAAARSLVRRRAARRTSSTWPSCRSPASTSPTRRPPRSRRACTCSASPTA